MKLQKKPRQCKAILWKATDLYTMATFRYAATLPIEQLLEAIAVVNYDVKGYKKLRRNYRRGTRQYWYKSLCIAELQMFLGNAKEALVKQAAQPSLVVM